MARFERTLCSSCGEEFGPGDSGYSHCRDHIRVVACAACDGGGRDVDEYGPCPYCEGTGLEEIKVEPLTLEDMEDLDHA
jgi:hypothetical protein